MNPLSLFALPEPIAPAARATAPKLAVVPPTKPLLPLVRGVFGGESIFNGVRSVAVCTVRGNYTVRGVLLSCAAIDVGRLVAILVHDIEAVMHTARDERGRTTFTVATNDAVPTIEREIAGTTAAEPCASCGKPTSIAVGNGLRQLPACAYRCTDAVWSMLA